MFAAENTQIPTSLDEQPILKEQTLFTIEQVASRTNMTKRTLRYYEEVGLFTPTGRTEGNYRRYSEEDVQQLERIAELRDLLGFSLTDIREIMQAEAERDSIKIAYRQETDTAAKLEKLQRADTLIRSQLVLIEEKIAGLEQMRAALYKKLEQHEQKIAALQQQ